MSDAAALKAQANAAFAAKKFPEASELYTQALALDPTNAVLYSNRSAARASLADWAGALEDASQCVELDPKFVKGYLRQGAALHGQRKLEEAAMAYEEGLRVDPSNAALLKAQGDVKRAMESEMGAGGAGGPADGLAKVFRDPKAMAKLAANPKTASAMADPQFRARIEELARPGSKVDIQGLFQDPRMLTAMGVLMGIDMEAMEREAGAETSAGSSASSSSAPAAGASSRSEPTPATTNDPDDAMPGLETGTPAPASGSTARKTTTVEDDEDEPMRPAATATSSSSSSKPKSTPAPASAPAATPAKEEDPAQKEALAHKARGADAYKRRDLATAAEAFEAAWSTWPQDVTFLTNLAAVQFEQGEYAACVETCERAVEQGRELRADYKVIAKALGRTGSAYEKQGDLDAAIRYYSKSLTEHRTADVLDKLKAAERLKATKEREAYIDPELAEKAREEGNALFKEGKFAEAVKSYTEAIKRAPTDPRGYNNRAAAYTKLAALPEALKDADEAIRVDPSFVKAHIRRSMVYFGMKEYQKAIDAAQEGMERDVEKKHTRELEQQLQKALMETYNQRQGETDEQTYERAMRDPEVQKIMSDPVMQSILQQGQSDPKALQDHMKNPGVRAKINKLVQAGIIKTR